jgi:hypothetical protein
MELSFCTRCGHRVGPYRGNTRPYLGEGLVGDYVDVYERPFGPGETLPEGLSGYWCECCRSLWCAASGSDTGSVWPCGHFMPYYVKFCGFCGRPAR